MQEMQEMRVGSLDQENTLEKEMATQSSILAGKFHRQRSLVGHSPWGRRESDTTEQLSTHTHRTVLKHHINKYKNFSKYSAPSPDTHCLWALGISVYNIVNYTAHFLQYDLNGSCSHQLLSITIFFHVKWQLF